MRRHVVSCLIAVTIASFDLGGLLAWLLVGR